MDASRFDLMMEKVQAITETGCWIFFGSWDQSGYGMVAIGGGRSERAHRASWKFVNGPIPEGLQVLHRCDTRCCVNPSHLFLGDNAANVADKVAKGRQAKGPQPKVRGSCNGHAKLSDSAVMQIRQRYKAGERQRDLAEEFDVCVSVICEAISGKTWGHVQ